MKYKWGREIASVSSDKFPIFNLSAKFLPILLLLLIIIAEEAVASTFPQLYQPWGVVRTLFGVIDK